MDIDVQHVAELSKLRIPEDKLEMFTQEMTAIVKMMEELPPLQSAEALLDTENVMVLRDDVVQPSLPREEILENAPETAAGCFLVPRTVE